LAVDRLEAVTSVPDLFDKNFHYFSKIFLHLRKFAVISQLRTNFADNALGIAAHPGSRVKHVKGDAVVRVSRLRRKP